MLGDFTNVAHIYPFSMRNVSMKNGRLSQWNARAVLVDKDDNPTPYEPPLTFIYVGVPEDICFSLEEHVETKIVRWPIPSSASSVRAFPKTVGITRRLGVSFPYTVTGQLE